MSWAPNTLQERAEEARRGEPFPSVTVRELLSWFASYKRGKHVVALVDSGLKEAKVTTWPHFNSVYLDQKVEIRPIPEGKDAPAGELAEETRAVQHEDPVPRPAQLSAANSEPVAVNWEAWSATMIE